MKTVQQQHEEADLNEQHDALIEEAKRLRKRKAELDLTIPDQKATNVYSQCSQLKDIALKGVSNIDTSLVALIQQASFQTSSCGLWATELCALLLKLGVYDKKGTKKLLRNIETLAAEYDVNNERLVQQYRDDLQHYKDELAYVNKLQEQNETKLREVRTRLSELTTGPEEAG